MSKFTEFLKLMPKAWDNKEAILEGWLNDLKLESGELSEEEVKEILRRRAICAECPLNSINAKKSFEYYSLYQDNYQTDRTDLHCSICGCPTNKKTSSLSSDCGLEEYNKEFPNNKQNLKWTKYETK